jgi:uncharacterized membrane protein
MISVPSSSIPRQLDRYIAARALLLAVAGVSLVAGAGEARADFKLCNGTSSRIGVALGFEGAAGWATEGWWNIPARGCETLLRGTPPSNYVYVYAVDYDRGGEWAGTSFMCTGDKSFRISGSGDCEKRGHRRTGFMEVDTGGSKDWTVQFNDPE